MRSDLWIIYYPYYPAKDKDEFHSPVFKVILLIYKKIILGMIIATQIINNNVSVLNNIK